LTNSASEAFLKSLAEKSFLKLWTIPNTFYSSGKELTDIIIPFGNDIIIISDKASRFDFDIAPELAWSRWYRHAVKDSLRQLKTAKQRVENQPATVFTDASASMQLPFSLGPIGSKKFHLVAIARPDTDPASIPPQWPSLTYVHSDCPSSFQIDRIQIGGVIVHVFDGPTINLLLTTLDTVSDFIAYLKGRAARMLEADKYQFMERDLLGAALIGWDPEPTGLPSLPPLETIVPGIWEEYTKSESADQRRIADLPSRIIDAFINQQHKEYEADRFLNKRPTFERHEQTMRLLAAESRFARRIIAHELHDILSEADYTTFWVCTIPSPTMPSLRYVWMTYPERPKKVSEEQGDDFIMEYLRQHVLVAQGLFGQTLVLGICLPNKRANDTANFTVLHDGSRWTDDDIDQALRLRELGIFDQLEAHDRVHFR
jgi:hypothetical protein